MENNFSRVRSAQDIIISSVMAAAGILLVILPTSVPVNILGFTLAFAGIVMFLVLKSSYVYGKTGEKLAKKERFFPASKMESISRALATDPEKVDLSTENSGNGLRLDVYYSRKSGHAYAQLFEYIPYKYQPCSQLFEYQLKDSNALIR